MLGRVFWFAVGAGVAVYAYTKVREYWRKASPESIAHRVVESAGGVGDRMQDFVDRVRSGMAEREAELRETVGEPGSAGRAIQSAD